MAVSSKAAQAAANRALLTVCREAVFIDPDGNEVGQRWPLVLNDDGALTNPAEVSVPFGAYRVRLFADDGTPQGDIDLPRWREDRPALKRNRTPSPPKR